MQESLCKDLKILVNFYFERKALLSNNHLPKNTNLHEHD